MTACGCAADWRIELLDLATGQRRRFANPIGLDFENMLNEPGSASVTFPVRELSASDVWPHTTSVAFNRISGPGASPVNPICEFIGIVEDLRADSGGSLTLGLKSIEYYLNYRLIPGTKTFTGVSQNDIGATLVNYSVANGIPLRAIGGPSAQMRDRTYDEENDKIILEAVMQLTQVINGPDYTVQHSFADGAYGTRMTFSDRAGSDVLGSVNARAGVSSYDLTVDATGHANRVLGVGEDPVLRHTADRLPGSIYPLFEVGEAWTDVSLIDTVISHTEGSVEMRQHPAALPNVTLAGTDVAGTLGLGDTIALRMDHGAIQYDGPARLVGKAWSSSDGSPTTVTLSLVPLSDSVNAILGAPASTVGCCE